MVLSTQKGDHGIICTQRKEIMVLSTHKGDHGIICTHRKEIMVVLASNYITIIVAIQLLKWLHFCIHRF